MGLSLVEMAIGRYPIPAPVDDELAQTFGPNAIAEHMDAAKNARPLPGESNVGFMRLNFTADFGNKMLSFCDHVFRNTLMTFPHNCH